VSDGRASLVRTSVIGGVVLGAIYTLSPLLVLCVTGLGLVIHWLSRELEGREKHWVLIVFSVAVILRLIVIAGLVLSADDAHPYTVLFGDEWIFKSRPLWLRNIGLGIPISGADVIYAFDETGMSGHLYALAYLQALVGDAPYGVHLFNILLYVSAVAIMYRLVRRSFGPLAALGGSTILLFLPSLFAWSVSALKEPIYMSLAVVEVLVVLTIVRGRHLGARAAAIVALVGLAFVMEEVRKGTLIVVGLGTVVGLAGSWIMQTRPRILLTAVAVPVLLAFALLQPRVEDRLMTVARDSVRYHMGHVLSPGVSYQLVDSRYYAKWDLVPQLPRREAAQFAVRAAIGYIVEPTPRHWQSPLIWAFLPEHLVWLTLVILVPIGVVDAMRRDRLLACVLLAHAAGIIMMVALTSGNIGTLIRHRDLSLPYLVWFSVLGLTALLRSAAPAIPQLQKAEAHGDR
jgi:hypothetical protein